MVPAAIATVVARVVRRFMPTASYRAPGAARDRRSPRRSRPDGRHARMAVPMVMRMGLVPHQR